MKKFIFQGYIHVNMYVIYIIRIWQEHQDVEVILITLFGAGFLGIKYGRGWN